MARSSLVRALQPIFGTRYGPYTGTQNLPVDAELESRLWMATILATVFYAIAVAYGVVFFFIRKSTLYLLSSAVIAIVSFVSAFFVADFFKQQVVEWGGMGSSNGIFLNMRIDIGAWVALVAGFILAGSYVLSRQVVVRSHTESEGSLRFASKTEPARTSGKAQPVSPTKFCRFCGAKIPRDSTFCEECGGKIV